MHNIDYISRKTSLFLLIGNDAAQGVILLNNRQNADGGWGLGPELESDVIDTSLALQALTGISNVASPERANAVGFLLSKQHANGGWSIGDNDSSVFLTANAFRALFPYRNTYAGVSTALTNAQNFLLGSRDGAGNFGEHFDTALALLALIPNVVDITPLNSSIGVLQGAQSANGSWDDDPYTTALALQALWLVSHRPPRTDVAIIQGSVIDAITRLPLAGVNVALTGPVSSTLTTSADGAFRFPDLPFGSYALAFTLNGYSALTTTTTAPNGQTFDLGALVLTKSVNATTGTVRGTIKDAATSLPLSGVTISVTGGLTATTGANGDYQISNVPPGSITATATLTGYSTASGTGGLVAGGTLVFSPMLSPAGAAGTVIQGQITAAATNQPLAGATVRVNGVIQATTDASGNYRITNVTPGTLTLSVELAGYDTVTAVGEVAANTTTVFSPKLYVTNTTPPGGNTAGVQGVVLDAGSGAPLAGVTIQTIFGGSAQNIVTGADGRFSLTGLSATTGTLTFSLASYATTSLSVTLAPLVTLDVGEVRLRKADIPVLLPDLIVSAVDRALAVNDPQTLQLSGTLTATIRNQGTLGAPAGAHVLAFYDRNANNSYDPGIDTSLGEATLANALSVDAEASVSIPLNGQLPFRDAPIHAWADSAQQVAELVENNNVRMGTMACQPDPGISGKLDLTASLLRLVDRGAGQGVSLSLRVGNASLATSAGPVSWWPGEGNTNDIADSNPGISEGSVAYVPGKIGQAFRFDGTNRVRVPNAPNLRVSQGEFTVEAWVKFDALSGGAGSVPGDMSIFDTITGGINVDGWRLAKQTDNRFWFCFGAGSNHCYDPAYTVFSTTRATTGVFYHVVAVKTATEFALYVNGNRQDVRALPASFVDTRTSDLLIGANAIEGAHLIGLIDEPKIYNRALSAAEILAAYNGTSASAVSAEVAFYDGDPAAGGILLGKTVVDAIPPGGFRDVVFDTATPISGTRDLYAVVSGNGFSRQIPLSLSEWQGHEQVSTPGVSGAYALRPDAGIIINNFDVNSAGMMVAAWREPDGAGNVNVYASRRHPQSGEIERTVLRVTRNAEEPAAAIDEAGNIIVAWRDFADPNDQRIWTSEYKAGQGWQPAQVLPNSPGGQLYELFIVNNARGDAMLTWHSAAGNSVWAARRPAGGSLGPAELVASHSIGIANPRTAIDAAGNAMVVWEGGNPGYANIHAARYLAGQGWQPAQQIETNNLWHSTQPQIALRDNGDGLATWIEGDQSGVYSVWTVAFVNGQWQSPVRRWTPAGGQYYQPAVAFDKNGNGLLVWYQNGGAGWQGYGGPDVVWAARYDNVSGWQSPMVVYNSAGGMGSRFRVAFDDFGNAMIVWTDGEGDGRRLWSRYYNAVNGWEVAKLVQDDNLVGYEGNFGFDGLGNVYLVWDQYTAGVSGSNKVRFAKRTAGFANQGINECRLDNNSTSTPPVTNNLGSITVSTDKSTYGASSPVVLQGAVSNTGSLNAAFSVQLQVEDVNGVPVQTFPAQSLGSLGSGASTTVTQNWNTGAVLAGLYRLRGHLRDASGGLVGDATAAFNIAVNDPACGQPTVNMLVTAASIPGNNPANRTPVLRYKFEGTGALTALSSIPSYPDSLVNDPIYVAFSPQNELFVSNRHGNVAGTPGSIARFKFDADGNFIANGAITGNSLEAVHGIAFSPNGELFAVNLLSGMISRFKFDTAGNAVPNGSFHSGTPRAQALAFSHNGELFITDSGGTGTPGVKRWRFDPATGAPISNGFISWPGAFNPHGIGFSSSGELFVADLAGNRVYRFQFDNAGNAVANGSIAAPTPLGVAFSPAGELFVTSHYGSGLSRFLFDQNGNTIPNGVVSTPVLGGIAIKPILRGAGDISCIATATTKVTTDKQVYEAWGTVNISGRVQNPASNTVLAPTRAEITVRSPAGQVVFTETRALGQLTPLALRDMSYALPLVDAVTGSYPVEFILKDADTGNVLSTATTSFQVNRREIQALIGSVAVTSAQVYQGDTNRCTEIAKNVSGTAIAGVRLVHQLINVDAGTVVNEFAETVDFAAGGVVHNYFRDINTAPLTIGNYSCVIKAELNGDSRVLAFGGFQVLEPPIKVSANLALGSRGRLLVLLDNNRCEAEKDEKEGGVYGSSSGHCDSDPHGPAEAPALGAQRAFLEQLLKSAGWSYTIAETADDFTREFYSGGYAAYALFSEREKLDENTKRALREAVLRGEGLFVAGAHDARNLHTYRLQEALGIKLIGHVSHAAGAQLTDSPLALTGIFDLFLGDKALRIKRVTASSAATYLLGGPAHDEDDPEDCSDSSRRYEEGQSSKDKDEHDECEGRPERYLDALTLNTYGQGKSALAGMDLLATATRDGEQSLAAQLLLRALTHIHPTAVHVTPRGVTPIVLTLVNQGIATPVRATIALPESVTVVDPTEASVQGNVLTWNTTLAVNETKTLTVYLRLPDTAGALTLRAQVEAPKGGTYSLIAEPSISINVETSTSIAILRQMIEAAIGQLSKDQAHDLGGALEHLDHAERYLGTDPSKALHEVLKAADALVRDTSAEVLPIRLEIARWVREISQQISW